MNQVLTSRDWDLIATLTGRVRILAASQLASLWIVSQRNRRVLRRRLKRLVDAGLLELHTINAHVLNPTRPLFAWRPGSPEPDAQLVSRRTRDRWLTPTSWVSSLLAREHGKTSGNVDLRFRKWSPAPGRKRSPTLTSDSTNRWPMQSESFVNNEWEESTCES